MKIEQALKELNKVYEDIPETKGCLEYINKPKEEGGCNAWCCQYNSPSVLFIEFKNTWNYISQNWSTEEIANIIIKAVENFMDDRISKTCIFFDQEKRLCTQHEHRPYACRMYSQTPEEEFNPKYERLKILYKDRPDAVIRPQCNLTETVGEPPTKEQSDKWWNDLVEIEKSIGIDPKLITDEPQGTYRTYHDHIILNVLPEKTANYLNDIKANGTIQEKKMAVKKFAENFKNKLEKSKKQVFDKREKYKKEISKAKENISILEEKMENLKNGS